MPEIAELIERLEKATGPDRKIGNDVLFACGWRLEEESEACGRAPYWISPDPFGEDFRDGDQPDPTASIDAALTLVPAGYAWTLATSGLKVPYRYWASVTEPDEDAAAVAATPAIALCIVILRARASLAQERREEGK